MYPTFCGPLTQSLGVCWWRGGGCKVCQSVGCSVLHPMEVPLPFGGDKSWIWSFSIPRPVLLNVKGYTWSNILPCILLTLPISTFSSSISHGAYLANLHLFLLNQPVLAQSHLLHLLLRSLLSLCCLALTGGGAPDTHSVPQPCTQQPNPALACLLQLSQLIIVCLHSNKNWPLQIVTKKSHKHK